MIFLTPNIILFAIFFTKSINCNTLPFFLSNNICYADECIQLGLEVSNSLNKSANPCKDFYNFACGGWTSKNKKPPHEIVWNNFQLIAKRINDRLKLILEDPKVSQSESLQKARTAYGACISNSTYLRPLKILIDYFGGWPLMEPKIQQETKYKWLLNVAKATRFTGSYPIIKMYVNLDFQNTSRHILYLDSGQLNLLRSILINSENHTHAHIMYKYKQWILKTIKYIYPNKRLVNLDETVQQMIQFEIELAKLSLHQSHREKISIKELSIMTNLNWKRIINALFAKSDVRVTFDDFVFYSSSYIKSVLVLINGTKPRQVTTNYIIWSIIRNLSRDISKSTRELNFEMDKAVFGAIQNDIPRPHECISRLAEYFGSTLLAKYVQQHVNPETIRQVQDMAENIQIEYISLLMNNKWLTTATRKLIVEKILAVKFLVGYPERMMNNSSFLDDYNQINISKNHFVNILNLKQLTIKENLNKLTKPAQKIWWPNNLLEPVGFYSVLHNSIIIPLGMLEPPFFDIKRPAVFNYAALGSLIGHEISHALDTTGRQADQHGNIRQWWAKEDINNYELNAECFIKQYAKYGIDSFYTVGENIADNEGLYLSYRAFKNQKLGNSVPFPLSYTDEQLFFITYSQIWCEFSEINHSILEEDEHAPAHIRVMGVVNNNREFQKSFNCSRIDDNYCYLW